MVSWGSAVFVVNLPKNQSDITAAWLSRALNRAVSVYDVTRIGVDEGFTGGGLFRVALDDGSVVVKLSPEEPVLRRAFAAANSREAQFYTMSRGQNLPVPNYYFQAFDRETGASALLIEDMGDMRSVPFLDGCAVNDVQRTVDALSQVHSAFWESEAIDDLPTLALLDEFDFTQMWGEYPAHVCELLPDMALSKEIRALGDWIACDPARAFSAIMKGPKTVVHGDAQLDNVLFGPEGAILLDWQFMGRGKGAHDLSFFLISSLEPDVRRTCEASILARYHRALGVAEYGFDDCKRDYLQGAVWRVFITAMATTQLDNATDHKRAWRRADLRRLMAFCEDHEITPQTI